MIIPYLCSVDVFRFINKCTDLGFRLMLEPFFMFRSNFRTKNLAIPKYLLIFAMPNNCSVLHRPSTRIDAQYEIGLFLCPSVNHIVGIHELVPYTKLAIFAICNKCIRLSFPHFICSEGEYYDCLATREMAAVLASYGCKRTCLR